MSGRYVVRSVRSCSKVPKVQSNTLVSIPSRRSWAASVAAPSGGNSISVADLVRKYGNTTATLDMSFLFEVELPGVELSLR